MSTIDMTSLVSLDAIRRAYAKACPNGHWFSPGAMRFFNSRLPRDGWRASCGTKYYFASSEKGPDGVRRYSVRVLDCAGEYPGVETVGNFQAYASLASAKRQAKALAQPRG